MGEGGESKRPAGPGFQGSDHSGIEATFYAHGNDPVFSLSGFKGAFTIKGIATPGANAEASSSLQDSCTITRATWSKQVSGAAGRWMLEIKTTRPQIFETGLLDDDWVDIVFTQHGRPYHVVRGMIDTIRRSRNVPRGATETTWIVSGRDFTKPFEVTNVFFNRFVGQNVGGGATLRAFVNSNQGATLWGSPDKTVQAFLFEFFRQLGAAACARWALPPGLPAVTDNGQNVWFIDAIAPKFSATNFRNEPARTAVRPMFLDPEGFTGHNLWQLAKEWSDPSFTEMFCDLVDKNSPTDQPGPGELPLSQSTMAVIFRDRPFPTAASAQFPISQSPWFQLPLYEVLEQEIAGGEDLGRGGEERFNAFFVRAAIEADFASANVDITKPIWNPDDIALRGIRRMDVTSTYAEPTGNNAGLVSMQREFLRDWYGLNPYFLNGTLPLGHLRPEIRVGTRIRIPGASPDENRTFYCEGVNHSWALGMGRTTLTVTRGWKGTEQSLMGAINNLATTYELAGSVVVDDSVTATGS